MLRLMSTALDTVRPKTALQCLLRPHGIRNVAG